MKKKMFIALLIITIINLALLVVGDNNMTTINYILLVVAWVLALSMTTIKS